MPKRSLPVRDVEDTPTSRADKRRTCAWRNCPTKLYDHQPPMCEAHLEIAHTMYLQRYQNDTPNMYRFRGPVTIKPEPAPPEPVQPQLGVVYILRCGGYVKIGWTADLSKRMRSYQPDTILMATMPGTRKDEHRLHKRFAHLRTHGREWYSLAPQITEYAALLVNEHGQPDAVTFAAKPVTVPRTLGGRVERVL